MMKNDYVQATIIAQDGSFTEAERQTVIRAFVELFYRDNPRFDEALFRAACMARYRGKT